MSVIVNLLQNAFACYMKLSHYKEAEKCVAYIKHLLPDYIKAYLLDAQVSFFNNAATIPQVRAAFKSTKEGVAISNLAVQNSRAYLPLL